MKKGVLLLALCHVPAFALAQEVSGELKKWHRITVTFDGPNTSEGGNPNPFLDYRLDVRFTHSGRSIVVPGFYAADGNAPESSASSGNKWRVHFTPDATGVWTYHASFRTGTQVAVSLDPHAGMATSFDGASGSLNVAATNKTGRDHRAKGLLRYVGARYRRFSETGEWYLKGGADSPENFLGYRDFDQTPNWRHEYGPHVGDWNPGDPTWKGGKGKGIIGALNYLASEGMNSVYFLTMNNAGGDGDDTWPWTSRDERLRFDCSKLGQWEIVFSHMDRLGIQLHVVTQETENDDELDGGALAVERKLYYRELIARFAHHLALQWNLGEENGNGDTRRKEFATWIRGVDPYDHAIVVHTLPGSHETIYAPLLGFEHFEGPSLQLNTSGSNTHSATIEWIDRSAAAGRPWSVSHDEYGFGSNGVHSDSSDPTKDTPRKNGLWGNLMAGGAGCEWYFPGGADLNTEDWRTRNLMWDQTRYALQLFQTQLPFTQMAHADHLTAADDDYCFAKPGEVYAVYLRNGGTTTLMAVPGTYKVEWFDPRNGGGLQPGRPPVTTTGFISLGDPPSSPTKDWVALVRRVPDPAGVVPPTATISATPTSGNVPFAVAFDGSGSSDPDGSIVSYEWDFGDGTTASGATASHTYTEFGTHTASLKVVDDDGAIGFATVAITASGIGPNTPVITGLVLVNALTNQNVGPIIDGATFDLNVVGNRLNIRADPNSKTQSVAFGWDGNPDHSTDSATPFALFGDFLGNYNIWFASVGSYTLSATGFPGPGGSGTAGPTVTVTFQLVDGPTTNRAPTANAGPDQSVTLPASASLDGSVSDPDGDTLITTWSKVSGPGAVTFGNPAAVDTTAIFSAPGTYVLRLTADDGSLTASDDVTLTANPDVTDTQPPTPPQNLRVTSVSHDRAALAWDASTDDVGVTGYRVFRDGVEVATVSGTNTTDAGLTPETDYTYTVTALDAAGNESSPAGSATATTTTSKVPVGPAVTGLVLVNADTDQDISPLSDGDTIDLSVDGTSLNIRAEVSGTVSWIRFALDGNPSYRTETAAPYALGGDSGGDYTSWTPGIGMHTLTATPSTGTALTISFQVTDQPMNQPPNVDAGADQTVTLPALSALDGTVTDEGPVVTTWAKVTGPGAVTFGDASQIDTTASFSDAGTYVLRLMADDGESTAFDEVTLTVEPEAGNRAPVVDAGPDQTITLPDSATLSGSASDPDGDPLTVGWEKVSGPGAVTFGPSIASFSEVGTYVLRLTANDGKLSASDEVAITVEPEPSGTPTIIASEDFEGGSSSWQLSGASVTRFSGPRGSQHLNVDGTDTATWPADLSGVSQAKLRFWYKASSFEAGDHATVEVFDGTWHEIFRLSDPQDDGTYRQVEIDLSGFAMISDFEIRVSGHMSSLLDDFYIDDIEIEGVGGTAPPPPPPPAGDAEPPTAPQNPRAVFISSSLVYLRWDASTDDVGVTGYAVLRNGRAVRQTTGTTFLDRSVVRGAQYIYTVVALDDAGNVSEESEGVGVLIP